MGSDTHHPSFEQPNSALLRFRSAPSSLFLDLGPRIDSKRLALFESSESERLSSGFGSCGGGGADESESPAVGDYFSAVPPHHPRLSSSSVGFLGSSLARQTSISAEVFSQLNQNGYGGGYNNGGEEVSPSSNRVNSEISFSEQLGNVKLATTNGEPQFFSPSEFPFASWNESSHFSEPFPGMKRDPGSNPKLFSSSNQNGENGNRAHLLSHHLSLPKNVSDITSIQKLLQLQDSVPCRIRAKRGCATHPRSIAERVRRTRISERMRKLQELVPNMDKQMNTADMLDLAVGYIKELQKQFKMLSDNRAKCVCLNMQKPVSNWISE